MANLQKYFEEFHAKIRTDYETNKTLRDKRDIILDRVRKYLQDNELPGFDQLLQGSYAVRTGVFPRDGVEYDIDVGLCFHFSENDYNPREVHKWIFDAVDGHTEKVEDRGPCIRVTYADGYHVDLVPYASWEDDNEVKQYRLGHKDNGWRLADPPELIEHVRKARLPFEGTEDSQTKTDQFRRCVRYLRRWYDIQIPGKSRAKPTGLGFILLAVQRLHPTRFIDGEADDRKALEIMAYSCAAKVGRLTATKPTPEHEDILTRLSDAQMDDLKQRFQIFASKLQDAGSESDPVKACKILLEMFGPDFPVPEPQDTGKKTKAPAIVTSSASAYIHGNKRLGNR